MTTKHSTGLTILLGAALLFAGYLGGTIAVTSDSGQALAAPQMDARGNLVTGDASSITFWKVKDGKVLGAHTYRLENDQIHESMVMPKAQANPPEKSGGAKACGSCGGGGSCG